MRFISMVSIVLGLTFLISCINYWLLSRWFFPGCGKKYGWLYVMMTGLLVVFYAISWRPGFAPPAQDVFRYSAYFALVWLVGQLLLAIILPLIYGLHRLSSVKQAKRDQLTDGGGRQWTRREFLHSAVAVTPLLAFGLSTKGVYEAESSIAMMRYPLYYPDLPINLEGYKIAQVSDSHLGTYFGLEKLEQIVKLLDFEKPDFIVITGDFVDSISLLPAALVKMNELQSRTPDGIYFCWGNHEYYRGINEIRAELQKSRLIILENSGKIIVPGPRPLYLMGADYPFDGSVRYNAAKRQSFFEAMEAAAPSNAFTIMIAHHPDFLFDGFANKIPLTLAGHTHGGQVVIGGVPVSPLPYRYMRGLYQENQGYGYVSSGAGHWIPFRFGCPPEISIFTLRKGAISNG